MDNKMLPDVMAVDAYIARECGIILGQDKAYILEAKLVKLLAAHPKETFQSLCSRIASGRDRILADKLIDDITTNETFWFRDKALWQTIDELLIPSFITALKSGDKQTIRIWSAACSYGQEPYSLAMAIDHYLRRHDIKGIAVNQFEIVASDVSQTALSAARSGLYDNIAIGRGMPEAYKNRYFIESGRMWKVDAEIQRMVRFETCNLIHPGVRFGQFDLVLLRNVLIYFSENHKEQVYQNMHMSLAENGTMFIGSSELMDDSQKYFVREQYADGVYYKKRRSMV
jgi:chemotaxis protein methyltransferase CheR